MVHCQLPQSFYLSCGCIVLMITRTMIDGTRMSSSRFPCIHMLVSCVGGELAASLKRMV